MFKEEYLKKLGEKIEKIEAQSSVELVIAVNSSSGSYRDIDAQNGFILAIIVLLVAVYSPWNFNPELLATLLFLAYIAGKFGSSKWAWLRRALTSKSRQRQQAEVIARSIFLTKRVSNTRARTGLFLYLSYSEKIGLIIADIGIEAAVPRAIFNDIEALWSKAKSRESFLAGVLESLDGLVEPLSKALPHQEDDENEISNEIYVVRGS